jgi:hypothetical protein
LTFQLHRIKPRQTRRSIKGRIGVLAIARSQVEIQRVGAAHVGGGATGGYEAWVVVVVPAEEFRQTNGESPDFKEF